ncbi:unnamed protein product [Penicillium roqueforti FM164]|uniref:Genomic scaffold, ProqFM164S02 n=1 Tax=Penicillium roqueforti (strain FM164) TaxID=1365484 RepID=W6Q5J1_PENRF|nr:unnamed protein product [Penicillium roqueforti FM164]
MLVTNAWMKSLPSCGVVDNQGEGHVLRTTFIQGSSRVFLGLQTVCDVAV